MDYMNTGSSHHVLISCSSAELADLRWLVGIAMQHFEEVEDKTHLPIALEFYKALHQPGCTPTPGLYLKRTP